MARIPREFERLEAGVYRFAGYLIRKEGVTSQNGETFATYVITDMDDVVGSFPTAGQAFAHIKSIEDGDVVI